MVVVVVGGGGGVMLPHVNSRKTMEMTYLGLKEGHRQF